MSEIDDTNIYEVDFLFLTDPEPAPVLQGTEISNNGGRTETLSTLGGFATGANAYRPPGIADYNAFAKKHFGEFPDMALLITAFTHRSFLNEHRGRGTAPEHNERLEFLGDAVLELVVTEHLYRNYSEPEGKLTDWRSALVRTESIGAAAEHEGFKALLRLSRGESRGSERARRQILANCYEAVLGAVYLVKGQSSAREFIERTLLPTLDEILSNGSWIDSKSRLQEITQAGGGSTPEYRLMVNKGPDHDKTFVVGVYVDGVLKGQGTGPNQKVAQSEAATNALNNFKHSLIRQSPGTQRPPGLTKF